MLKVFYQCAFVGCLLLITPLNFFCAIISKPIDKFQTLNKLLNILPQWLQLPIDSCCNKNSTASYANQVGFFGEDPIFLDSTNLFVFSPERPLRLSIFSQLQYYWFHISFARKSIANLFIMVFVSCTMHISYTCIGLQILNKSNNSFVRPHVNRPN
jgi:hypothetical protein